MYDNQRLETYDQTANMKGDGSESIEPCDKAAYFASQMDQPLYAQAHLNNINFGEKKVRKNSAKEFNV